MTKNNKQKNIHANWQFFSIGNILDYEQPTPFVVNSTEYKKNGTPVLTAGKTFILGYTDEENGIYKNLPVIIFDDFTTAIKYVDFPFKVKSSAMKILKNKPGKSNIKFVFGWMQTHKFIVGEHKRNYLSEYQYLDILLPPIEEQNKIVQILETWDNHLEKLNKKIEIKKQIKKSLMQNLLTGKVRIGGFSGEWKTLFLKDLGDVRTSSVDKKCVDGEQEIGLLNYMDVYKRDHISRNDTFQRITAKSQQINSSNLKKGDVLFTPSSETQDDIGHSAVVVEDLEGIVFSYHLMRFRPKNHTVHYRFSAYCFKTYNFYLELWKKSQGATRFTLSKDALEKSKITIPLDIKEQVAIAKIFEMIDEEIECLIKKKKIVEAQKKFLLNNLISGKIRHPEFINL